MKLKNQKCQMKIGKLNFEEIYGGVMKELKYFRKDNTLQLM